MKKNIYEILEEVLKEEKEASKQDASNSSWTKQVNYFANYPNKERFKKRYMKALRKKFPSIIPDEKAISFIVDKEISCAYLAEQMGKEHTDYDSLNSQIDGQINALSNAKEKLAKNIITANQLVNAQNGIDESLLETLRLNEFGGAFTDPTLNYAYQSYCEIQNLQQENERQQEALTQGMNSIEALIGIAEKLNNDCYYQNEALNGSITSLRAAQEGITALSKELQAEKAKGPFSRIFERFRKPKYLAAKNTTKTDPSSSVSSVIKTLKSSAQECTNTDKYEEQIKEHRIVLRDRKQGKKNEQDSKSTPSNKKDNSSLQWENDLTAENTNPNTTYAQQNHLRLQELQKRNALQQQAVDQDTQNIESLLTLIDQLREQYVAPNATINESVATLNTAKQKIDDLSKELSIERGKPFATRLVEAIKKIRVSKSQEDESSEKGTSGIVSQIVNSLKTITDSYSATLDNKDFTSIKSRLRDREQSATAQLKESAQGSELGL